MGSIRGTFSITLLCILVLAGIAGVPAIAGTADHWYLSVAAGGSHRILGSSIGVDPQAKDGYDSGDGSLPSSTIPGILLMCYRENGTAWTGPTGFYGGDIEHTPVAPGGSKTWPDFYRWAQNYTPTSADLVGAVAPSFSLPPPVGYRGHLVLDYVPVSCNWTGPMDIWLNDLTAVNTFALPIPVVTDPLQGTQFHIDVYAPAVPEPSSLAALVCGFAGVGGVVVRRRRG